MLRNPKEKSISKTVFQNVQYHWKCALDSISLYLRDLQKCSHGRISRQFGTIEETSHEEIGFVFPLRFQSPFQPPVCPCSGNWGLSCLSAHVLRTLPGPEAAMTCAGDLIAVVVASDSGHLMAQLGPTIWLSQWSEKREYAIMPEGTSKAFMEVNSDSQRDVHPGTGPTTVSQVKQKPPHANHHGAKPC